MDNTAMLAERDPTRGRLGQHVWALFAIVPYAAVVLLLVFAWHTSRSFGSWPSYAQPDPKDANTTLYAASGFAILAAFPSIAALVVGLPILRRLRLTRSDVLVMLVGGIGLVVLLTVFSGNLGDWYMD